MKNTWVHNVYPNTQTCSCVFGLEVEPSCLYLTGIITFNFILCTIVGSLFGLAYESGLSHYRWHDTSFDCGKDFKGAQNNLEH